MREFFGLAETHRVVLSFEERSARALSWLARDIPEDLYAFFGHYDGGPPDAEFLDWCTPRLPGGAEWMGDWHLRIRDAVTFVTDHDCDLTPYYSVWVTKSLVAVPMFPFPYLLSGRWPWKEGDEYQSGGALTYDRADDLDGSRSQATGVLSWMVENDVIAGVLDGYVALGIKIVPTSADGTDER